MSDRKFAFYCTCGGAMTGAVSPAANATELEHIFRSVHARPGCSPTDAPTARLARARHERELERVR